MYAEDWDGWVVKYLLDDQRKFDGHTGTWEWSWWENLYFLGYIKKREITLCPGWPPYNKAKTPFDYPYSGYGIRESGMSEGRCYERSSYPPDGARCAPGRG